MTVLTASKAKHQNTYEGPVMITKSNGEFYSDAGMFTIKDLDVVLESALDPDLGSDIMIRIENGNGSDESKTFRAKVIWCEEILNDYTFRYMLGARIYESF